MSSRSSCPSIWTPAKRLGGARHGPDFQNLHRNKRGITLDLKSPQGAATFSPAGGQGRRGGRELPPRREDAARHRLPGAQQDQPAPRLCQHLRLRPGRPLPRAPGRRPDRPGPGRPDVDHGRAGPRADARGHPHRRSLAPASSARSASWWRCWSASSPARARRSRPRCCRRRSSCSTSRPRAGSTPARCRAGRQQPSDQHPDRRVQDARRPHQHRHRRRRDVEASVQGHRRAGAAWTIRSTRPGAARLKNRDALNAAIDSYLADRTSAEWIERLNAAGVPCGMINAIDKMFADPQVAASRHRAGHRDGR